MLLSHSNISSKFQAGIVTALGRARCCYRLREDDQYCTTGHTLMGVTYNMQPIVGGGSIGGEIYITIHIQCGNIWLDGLWFGPQS